MNISSSSSYFCTLLNFKYGSNLSLLHNWIIEKNLSLRKSNSVEVVLGAHNLSKHVYHRKVKASSYIIHRKWSPETFQNDIALLKLSTRVTFSRTIQPVVLAQQQHNYIGKIGITIGWGVTENGQISRVLRSMESLIIPNTKCREIYKVSMNFN